MRVDKRDPRLAYRNFGDWLLNYGNLVFIVVLPFGYAYYLATTNEAGRSS